MQLVRQLLADPLLMYHLFANYDLSTELKLNAVQVHHCFVLSAGSP